MIILRQKEYGVKAAVGGFIAGSITGNALGGKIGSKIKRNLNEKETKENIDNKLSEISELETLINTAKKGFTYNTANKSYEGTEAYLILGKYSDPNQPDDYSAKYLNKNKNKVISEANNRIKEIKKSLSTNASVGDYSGNFSNIGSIIGGIGGAVAGAKLFSSIKTTLKGAGIGAGIGAGLGVGLAHVITKQETKGDNLQKNRIKSSEYLDSQAREESRIIKKLEKQINDNTPVIYYVNGKETKSTVGKLARENIKTREECYEKLKKQSLEYKEEAEKFNNSEYKNEYIKRSNKVGAKIGAAILGTGGAILGGVIANVPKHIK